MSKEGQQSSEGELTERQALAALDRVLRARLWWLVPLAMLAVFATLAELLDLILGAL